MRYLFLVLALVGGCGKSGKYAADAGNRADESTPATTANPAADSTSKVEAEPAAADARVQRRIIYTAQVDLVVKEFGDIADRIEALAQQARGYIARSNLRGAAGSPRSGEWTVRIPVEGHQAFVQACRNLGEVLSVDSDSQDVSEEFFDTEARVRNQQAEESRLLAHLEKSTGSLEEILTVEREISRVRGEIERMQGRLRLLSDQTQLSTVILKVSEIKNYVPTASESYADRVGRVLNQSASNLLSFLQALSLVCVALAPWLPMVLAPACALIVVIRRYRRATVRLNAVT